MTTESLPVLAILGGTGDLGTGLARRWAQAGYQVIIGSRTQEKAEAAVNDLREVMAERGVGQVTVQALENLAAAEAADIVTITVPFSHQASTLELVKPALQGKILIDVTVPLVPPKVARVQLPAAGQRGTDRPGDAGRGRGCSFCFSECGCCAPAGGPGCGLRRAGQWQQKSRPCRRLSSSLKRLECAVFTPA